MKRTDTKIIKIGNITMGNSNHVYIQSMTNTKTSDIDKTINQINELIAAGAELVRVAVFDDADAASLSKINKASSVPVIADIHFSSKYAKQAIEAGCPKIRLNPGNINKDKDLNEIIDLAQKHGTAIRIGVNSGSLPLDIVEKYGVTAQAMVMACERYLKLFEAKKFYNIVLSLKASNVKLMIASYRLAAQKFDYPLHLGVTEAGPLFEGTIKSVAGLTPLLLEGIGNTIRVSLTGDPVDEVYVAKKLLNNLDLLSNMVDIISCPTCGRMQYDMIPIVNQVKEYVANKPFPLKISILGCVVNGIGEGKEADIGVAGGKDVGIIFEHGKILKTVPTDKLFGELKFLIDKHYKNFLEAKTKKE